MDASKNDETQNNQIAVVISVDETSEQYDSNIRNTSSDSNRPNLQSSLDPPIVQDDDSDVSVECEVEAILDKRIIRNKVSYRLQSTVSGS